MSHHASGCLRRPGHLLTATAFAVVFAVLPGALRPSPAFGGADEPVSASTATAAPPGLLADAVVADATELAARPPTNRERIVTVDVAALEAMLATGKLRLPLFPDVVMDLSGSRQDSWASGFSWTGGRAHTAALPEQAGLVQITHATDTDAAAVHANFWDGTRRLQLQPVADGLHAVLELSADAYSTPDGSTNDGHDHDSDTGSSEPIDPLTTPQVNDYGPIDEAGVAESYSASAMGPAVKVDIVAVYTPAAARAVPNITESIRRQVNLANLANQRSGLAFRFRLAHVAAVNAAETKDDLDFDLARFGQNGDGFADAIHELRMDYAGDLALFVGKGYGSTNQRWMKPAPAPVCGLGQVMNITGAYFAERAFSAIDIDPTVCDDTTGPHEFGHNLALEHDWATTLKRDENKTYRDSSGVERNYVHGYYSGPAGFGTIMAYRQQPDCVGTSRQCTRIPNWSNPNVAYNGYPTGMPEGTAMPAFNAKVLTDTTPVAADFRQKLDPFGSLEGLRQTPGAVVASGWALDYDQAYSQQLSVHLYVDGVHRTTTTTSRYRPDVKERHPGWSGYHGWATSIGGLSPGAHTFCAYGINVGYGLNGLLGTCKTFTVLADPIGSFDGIVRVPGGGQVKGWSLDPDYAGAVTIQVSVDGTVVASGPADEYRADIAAAYPEYGGYHGYAVVAPMSAGIAHTVCVTAVNIGPGTSSSLGCKTFTPAANPIGGYDGVSRHPSGILVKGWALDLDVASAIYVNITVDGVNKGNFSANQSRPDVGSAYPAYGSNHGFAVTLGVTRGSHTVCVTAVNVNAGSNVSLGCKGVYVDNDPFGALTLRRIDSATIEASGWAIDPDTYSTIQVVLSIDVQSSTVDASEYRSDVGAAYPNYGPHHGFRKTFVAAANAVTGVTYTVCATGKNVGAGSDISLGCQTVS